jgi:hypothetical protein
MARVVWFDHAPFSPFLRQGQIHRDEFPDENSCVSQGDYPLLGAEACNGIAVPELMTGEVRIQPVVVRQRRGGNCMY